MDFENLIDRAIIGTSWNYPTWDMAKQMETAVFRYLEEFENGTIHPVRRFCAHFSSKIEGNGLSLRRPILEHFIKDNYDVSLGFLDMLYKYGIKKIADPDITNFQAIDISRYINGYLGAISNYISDNADFTDLINNSESPLNDIKDMVYKDPLILKDLVSNSLNTIKTSDSKISGILHMYIDDIRKKDVFNMDSIDIIEISDTARSVLTNIKDSTLVDSFSGSLLDGKITVASDRSYIDRPDRRQDDSVWTGVKSDDCFLAIVADGVGGVLNGQIASMAVVGELADCFNRFSEEDLKSLTKNELAVMFDRRLVAVNNELVSRYNGQSATTVVFALCVGDSTIIGNIGDSLAYSYDDQKDELVRLTSLHSPAASRYEKDGRVLSYEEIRNNEYGNIVSKTIGSRYISGKALFGSYHLFHNEGEKVILSSDGVTDLASEERFKGYFRKDTGAGEIVYDAVYRPETTSIKHADNTSAIVIQLPNNYDKDMNASRRI